jgi:dienelactone hydrolase
MFQMILGGRTRRWPVIAVMSWCMASLSSATNVDTEAKQWVEQFRFAPPTAETEGLSEAIGGELPTFAVKPFAAGLQLVRVSLPFAPGAFPVELGLVVEDAKSEKIVPDVRVLTFHAGRPSSVRRAILTFAYDFEDATEGTFSVSLQTEKTTTVAGGGSAPLEAHEPYEVTIGETTLRVGEAGVDIERAGERVWHATLSAPERSWSVPPAVEVIERGEYYFWVRLFVADELWPRIVEVRADSLGTVAVQAHLQRLERGDGTAPDLGWDIRGPALESLCSDAGSVAIGTDPVQHSLENGGKGYILTDDGREHLSFPIAPLKRRGSVKARNTSGGSQTVYLRCREADLVPHQEAAWRRAEFVVAPTDVAPLNALLEPQHAVTVAPEAFDSIYGSGRAANLAQWPVLDQLRRYHDDAIIRAMRFGDDLGNVTAFNDSGGAGVFGMNRLNHCPPIFAEYYRCGDARLRDVALQWCSNFHDLTIWWGTDRPGESGGTRYNNAVAAGRPEHKDDTSFMWRSNDAVNFCTKGYDSFFYAYEETGDPRMAVALRAQLEYARAKVHADQGECRNIGDVLDFVRLYQFTGESVYREEALRLFRELRTRLSPGDLFSQGGQPIVEDPPFIDDDQIGYRNPFAKPYIIGYALAGLPQLAVLDPDEPKLRDVVRAVADFLAESQDPVGGWRYPHPRSSRCLVSQAMEHAAQLCRAAAFLEGEGEPIGNLLDAVERTLQARVLAWNRTGRIFSSLGGWEQATGLLDGGTTTSDLYKMPADRDPTRDYADGSIGLGGSSPEGLVYFSEVLDFYLKHRPAERLTHPGEALRTVLNRMEDNRLRIEPLGEGSFIRVTRPDAPDIGFTLWAPEWITFPKLGYGKDELGGMAVPWETDADTGAVSYMLDRPEATFTASFVPHVETLDCFYTVRPKADAELPGSFAVGPCLQLKSAGFEGDDADLMSRVWFLSNGRWVNLGEVAGGNSRNVLYIAGNASPEISGAMADSGWRTIQYPRPDIPLVAATSRDGKWVVATAAEHSTSICNNANASHRCMHSQGSMPLRQDGPTTLRVRVYLFEGTLDELARRYRHDVELWKRSNASPVQFDREHVRYGMAEGLPAFRDARVKRMTFPLAYRSDGQVDFAGWRTQARAAYIESLLTPPPSAPFEPVVIAREDRGTYEARKVVFNISADSRVLAYLLVPKGDGPFPAIVALHDHGAHFSIGKEKVVRPSDEPRERIADAVKWSKECYGGRFIGDELAKRGYVVFATDALFWSDRGRREGVAYPAQQQLAANMLQLGMSWAGTIVWDDIRSAEFVAGLPEVDPERIGAVGLSMGSNRAWHLAAATDRICAAAAICWLGTTESLMSPGNNQTTGQSAFSMTHPGLRNYLDYADVASIACPKPMLFYNGEKDSLFPIDGVEAAYARMRDVWESQGAGDKLVTKIWPVPHVFNEAMQQEAFDWLDTYLQAR